MWHHPYLNIFSPYTFLFCGLLLFLGWAQRTRIIPTPSVDPSFPSILSCDHQRMWTSSLVLKHHVVLGGKADASPQDVLQHRPLLGQSIHHWCATGYLFNKPIYNQFHEHILHCEHIINLFEQLSCNPNCNSVVMNYTHSQNESQPRRD